MLFDEIKAAVPIMDAAQRYGLTVDRHGRALCPYHSEKTPSFKLYPDSNTFHCFGCQQSGDVTDLTMHLTGSASSMDAAKLLNADYSLGLDVGGAPDPAAARRWKADRDKLADFDAWCERACNTIIQYHKLLRRWKTEHAPKSPEEVPHPLFVEACQREQYIENLFHQVFIDGDFKAKAGFWRTHQEEVKSIERELERNRKIGNPGERRG